MGCLVIATFDCGEFEPLKQSTATLHCHRIFQAMIGESLNEYVKRWRMEKSLQLMSFGKRKWLTVIAIECGFSFSSDFTRSFKQKYGIARSQFDIESWRASHTSKHGSESLSDMVSNTLSWLFNFQ